MEMNREDDDSDALPLDPFFGERKDRDAAKAENSDSDSDFFAGVSSVNDPLSEESTDSEIASTYEIGAVSSGSESIASNDTSSNDSMQASIGSQSDSYSAESTEIASQLTDNASNSDNSEMWSDPEEDFLSHFSVINVEASSSGFDGSAGQGIYIDSPPEKKISCDVCGRASVHDWYRCIICNDRSLNICQRCEHRGTWCYELGHRLYHMVNGRPIRAISYRRFRPRQELSIFKRDAGKFTRVFRFREFCGTDLHNSNPVGHPKHPIVVWPLSGSELLFADYQRNNFFRQKIESTGVNKRRSICVNMSFSACGEFLRLAIVDIVTGATTTEHGETERLKPNIYFHLSILVLELSSTYPIRTHPKLIDTTGANLGYCLTPLVPIFPFAFTWTESTLYVTKSDSQLRVYKFELGHQHSSVERTPGRATKPERTKDCNLRFTVPQETIFLPRSARSRVVQFFPLVNCGDKSLITIGPLCGDTTDPPVVIYLNDQDLGAWVPPQEKIGEKATGSRTKKRLKGPFEAFNADEDCVIIPV
ncbi:hypothetical protein F5Y08DRAFT_345903 [Xylaria arbuscula]|nr:hypothetical protein F5Y08DRAFT_345903 [Xylaria arbuscula]